jgi:hypothetical protein
MATKARGTRTTGTAKETLKPRSPRRSSAASEPRTPTPPKSPGTHRTPKTHKGPGTSATAPTSTAAITPPLAAARAPRAAAPAPTLPPPNMPRRAVFIDVENTSSEAALSRVLDELQIDLTNGATEVTAIGNWRLAGPQLGRSLARRGAILVHSAPAARVSDWSDLWIAVQAGIWLGRSRPGDILEIVSHDRAFDAVGDAAARLGVTFRRLTYHGASAGAAATAAHDDDDEVRERHGRRRSRRGRRHGAGSPRAASPARPAAPVRTPAYSAPRSPAPHTPVPVVLPAAAAGASAPHGASDGQLRQIIAQLAGAGPSRTVTLDALTLALKAAGFQRPPGSPRLVTRLRRMTGVEVLPNSRLRLVEDAAGAAPAGLSRVD